MNGINKLAATTVGAAAVAMLLGTSAFADWRPAQETNAQQQQQQTQRQERRDRQQNNGEQRGNWNRNLREGQSTQQPRQYDRQQQNDRGQYNRQQTYDNRGDRQQTYNRDQYNRQQTYNRDQYNRQQTYNRDQYNRQQTYDRNRSYDRHDSYNRSDGRDSYNRYDRNRSYDSNRGYRNDARRSYGAWERDSRRHEYHEGRVERIMHERDGYRVWLSGGRYSYWVPEARWRLWPLRVGLSVRIGGYYDPYGYIDAYEIGPLGGPIYTGGDLRGVVESVDWDGDRAVIRDDISGAFVTAMLRGGDPQMRDLRPGDYVDLSGNWTRGGYFQAYQIAGFNPGQY